MTGEAFIEQFARWAQVQPAVAAAGLVGSWARGDARPDSDVDAMIFTPNPGLFLDDWGWLAEFGVVKSAAREDWGVVQSVRVFYEDGPEVEFGLTTPAWAAIDPVDAGTREVASAGLMVLYDPDGVLAGLVEEVRRG